MLRKTLDRLRKRHQGIGYWRLGLYGWAWLLRTVSAGAVELHYRYVLLQEVPGEPLLKGRSRGLPEVRVLEGAELLREFDRDVDGAFSRPPRDRPRVQMRVERGDICIAAARSARTVGVLWLSFGTFEETAVNCRFVVNPSDRVAWDSNLFIVEEARGGLIFVALWDGANAVLRERGYGWTATETSAFNGPSLQAHERLGAYRIGRIVHLCLGSLQVTFSSLHPHFHIAGPSAEGPVFLIPPPPQSPLEETAR